MTRKIFLFILLLIGMQVHVSGQKIGNFTFAKLPQDFQLYPRESTNLADVAIEGVTEQADLTAVSIRVLRNGLAKNYVKIPLTFTAGKAKFLTSFRITAELAEYDFEVFGFKGTDSSMVVRRKNVVAGDAFLVTGQSNSWIGPIDDLVYQGEWLRSFGLVQGSENYGPYNVADTLWSLPINRARVGPWAAEMGRLLIESEKIPISIINSGAGGSVIDWHLILDGNIKGPIDGGNIMYYKALKAGVLNKVKAILYRQGENEAADGGAPYLWGTKFNTLLGKYKKNFPAAQYVFAPQIDVYEYRNTYAAKLREDVRQAHTNNPYVKSFATVGTQGFDRIHYSNAGYRQTALEQSRLLGKFIYKQNKTIQIESPNIQRAYFLTASDRTKLFLEFEEGQEMIAQLDTSIINLGGGIHSTKLEANLFSDSFNSVPLGKSISKIEAKGNIVILHFTQNYNQNIISYLPDFTRDFMEVNQFAFAGPFIKNKLGMRAFAFSAFPITIIDKLTFDFTFYPNPTSDRITIRWDNPVNGHLEIKNMLGQVVMDYAIESLRTKSIDMQFLPAANYFITFKSDTGLVFTKRLVIIH